MRIGEMEEVGRNRRVRVRERATEQPLQKQEATPVVADATADASARRARCYDNNCRGKSNNVMEEGI